MQLLSQIGQKDLNYRYTCYDNTGHILFLHHTHQRFIHHLG